MKALTTGLYEAGAALVLCALAYLYLSEPRLLPLGRIIVALLYIVIAVGAEALIASSRHASLSHVFGRNATVACVVFGSGLASGASAGISALLAATTLTLRVAAALVAVRLSAGRVWRGTAVLSGATLAVVTLAALYSFGDRLYHDYIVYPGEKEGYIIPTSLRDVLVSGVLLIAALAFLYVSYRLLRFARKKDAEVAGTR